MQREADTQLDLSQTATKPTGKMLFRVHEDRNGMLTESAPFPEMIADQDARQKALDAHKKINKEINMHPASPAANKINGEIKKIQLKHEKLLAFNNDSNFINFNSSRPYSHQKFITQYRKINPVCEGVITLMQDVPISSEAATQKIKSYQAKLANSLNNFMQISNHQSRFDVVKPLPQPSAPPMEFDEKQNSNDITLQKILPMPSVLVDEKKESNDMTSKKTAPMPSAPVEDTGKIIYMGGNNIAASSSTPLTTSNDKTLYIGSYNISTSSAVRSEPQNADKESAEASKKNQSSSPIEELLKKINEEQLTDIPEEFLDPIHLHIMQEPVLTDDTLSYEESSAKEMIATKRLSHQTGQPITQYLKNQTLKTQIIEYLEKKIQLQNTETVRPKLNDTEVSAIIRKTSKSGSPIITANSAEDDQLLADLNSLPAAPTRAIDNQDSPKGEPKAPPKKPLLS